MAIVTMIKNGKLGLYEENSEKQELIRDLGPGFFDDKSIIGGYYLEKISQSKPFDSIYLDYDRIDWDELVLQKPIRILGNGRTTLYIKKSIRIAFAASQGERVVSQGFREEDINLDEFLHKLKPNRVVFQNL